MTGQKFRGVVSRGVPVEPLLSIRGLTKVFPGQVALDHVDLDIDFGSTHALVGQNGSGKSTLIKILAGYHQPAPGYTATIMGADGPVALRLGDGRAAAAAGIRFVHQDLGIVDAQNAVENLALGGTYQTRGGRIAWKAEAARAHAELADIGFDDFDVMAPVGSLAPSQRTAVALARALRGWEQGARLLVLDEPSASLPGADVERLFHAIRRLQARRVSILYVSHHLDELFEIADTVTVFRDGRRVTTSPIVELDHDRLIELMVGHVVEKGRATPSETLGDPLLEVTQLTGGRLRNLDLAVRGGEVVGLAGITGSGRESVIPLLIGEIPHHDGWLRVGGADVPCGQPKALLRQGLAFVTSDRQRTGNLATLSVAANTSITDVRRHRRGGRLRHGSEHAEAASWVERLKTRTAGTGAPIATLSGGNQQKVLFARGLRLQPRVLMLDEPTRGIDVGAKEEIHQLIDNVAASGGAVVVASSDTEELVRVSHRVIIFQNGRPCAELSGDDLTVEAVERAQLISTISS
jgi:ribose transport system ATP-binding protein